MGMFDQIIKVQDNVSTYLIRFEDEDEMCYDVNWYTGLSCMLAAIDDNYLEEMVKAI